jgi:hypothetical protein
LGIARAEGEEGLAGLRDTVAGQVGGHRDGADQTVVDRGDDLELFIWRDYGHD